MLVQEVDSHASPNRFVAPLTTSSSSEGVLSIGGCSVDALAKEHSTPLWIVDQVNHNSCII